MTLTMDCRICNLKQRQFICETCLRTHIHDLRQQAQHYATDRNDYVVKARKALTEVIEPNRTLRAKLAALQQHVDEMQKGLDKLRKDNALRRDRLRTLRETLASRRRNLSAAKLQTPLAVHPTINQVPREAEALTTLSTAISRARAGLVQELIEVFNVVEVGGRPPIGGKAGTKGEWTIGDLILPVPGDMRRYPPDHINAVLTHSIHFLALLTFYLGIKLPFEVIWSGGKLGVGQPWIGATMGTESGGWARWHSKQPLHIKLSTSPAPVTPLSSQFSAVAAAGRKSPPNPEPPENVPISSSILELDPPTSVPQAPFTTALAMLLYDVSYLGYTQNVEVPLSQAGDVLSNLWMVCCSSELGRKSHETYPHLPPPTPPSFPLDFSQLLQATVTNPTSKRNIRTGRTSDSNSNGKGRISSLHIGDKIEEVLNEGEGDWDLVDDDV